MIPAASGLDRGATAAISGRTLPRRTAASPGRIGSALVGTLAASTPAERSLRRNVMYWGGGIIGLILLILLILLLTGNL
jgi:hypothetical protein